MSNKIYPIGIQNFEKIRKGGYCYIDKTAWIYQMVKTGSYYFLSRPRRFGKSLLLSTLEAYFQGKKKLFEGLAIEKLEKTGLNIRSCILTSIQKNTIHRKDLKIS